MTTFHEAVEAAGLAIDAAGVAIIVAGVLFAAVRFVAAGGAADARYRRMRQDLGRGILLGLELLVAADIIRTVALEPTLDNVLVLGVVVMIRTFLSMSLQVELEGRWPWQRAASGRDEPAATGR
jgi:uncharacterized membrane protein